MDEAVLGFTARVVSGYVSNNRLSGEQLPELIEAVYRSLSSAGVAVAAAAAKIEPAVAVKSPSSPTISSASHVARPSAC